MASPDANIPNFRTYCEGKAIPAVNPEEIKRVWGPMLPSGFEDLRAACGPAKDVSAILRRCLMIQTLNCYKVLTPWQHGEELDDAVFRVAATFPLREFWPKDYRIAGDERFGFDPNAFVQCLVEETGISHVWEPIPTKVPEGQRGYSIVSATFSGQGPPDPESEAKSQARQLLWQIWIRFARLGNLLPLRDRETVSGTALLFDHFVTRNRDLLHKLEAGLMPGNNVPDAILIEVERRAYSTQRTPYR
jgi:hypothetical protein